MQRLFVPTHSCPNTATHFAKCGFKTTTYSLVYWQILHKTFASAFQTRIHAINTGICDYKVYINILSECVPTRRLRIFMTQSIHILKVGRDEHARTHDQPRKHTHEGYVHSSGLGSSCNGRGFDDQKRRGSAPAAAVVSQQVYAQKLERRARTGGLEIPVCGGCCGGDSVIKHTHTYYILFNLNFTEQVYKTLSVITQLFPC